MSKPPSSALLEPPSSEWHLELDPAFADTDSAVKSLVGHLDGSQLNNVQLSLALHEIMARANRHPRARTRVLRLADCEKIIEETPQVRDAVRSAISDRHFEKVVDLPILQQEDPIPLDSSRLYRSKSACRDTIACFDAFYMQYRSHFPAALLAAVDHYRSLNRIDMYNHSISIVQSSGTGKSRGIEETAKFRFTFLFNLRRGIEGYAYPHPDTEIRWYFVGGYRESDDMIQDKYAAFLYSLFNCARKLLSQSGPKGQDLPQWWYTYLNEGVSVDERPSNRVRFYNEVVREAYEILESKRGENNIKTMLRDSCKEFINYLNEQYGKQHPRVACVLAFDEAQELTEPQKGNRTFFDNLELTLRCIASYSVFSVYLSTNSNLWALAPPPNLHPSIEMLQYRQKTHPPITELPFDVFAGDLYDELIRDNKSVLGKTCSIGVMSRFGRAMWYTLHSQHYGSVMGLALAKLNPQQGCIDADTNAQLACLGIRLGLDFDASRKTGRQAEFELVELYMRVAYAVPEHCEFMRSGTPSEPILAEAAAQLLNTTNLEKLAPTALSYAFQNAILEREGRGELVGRLLWTLAHDAVLRDGHWDFYVQFHRPIRVIDFLQKLFHKDHWKTILDCRPVDDPHGEPLSEAFNHAYIHFSHFVDAMDHDIIQLKQVYKLLLRGAALRCNRNQRSVDFLTPIIFGSPDSTDICISNTSVFQAQVKNHNHPAQVVLDPSLVNPDNNHPVLSLVLELTSSSQGVQCLSKSNGTARKGHYQITALGCSPKTYGVIPADQYLDRYYAVLLGSNILMEDFGHTMIPGCRALFDQVNPCFELQEHDENCAWFGQDRE